MNGSDIKCPLACPTFYSFPEMGFCSSSRCAAWLLLLGAVILAEGEKLLVVPMDGSHWLSMKPVVEKIGSHGHQVVVLSPDSTLSMTNSSLYTLKYYSVAYNSQYVKASIQKFGGSHFNRPPFPGVAITMFNLMMDVYYMFHTMCSTLLNNRELMEDLREEKFDAVLTDSFVFCGVIVAEYLDVPTVNFLRGMPCTLDFSSAQCPSPLSYVPRYFSKLTDKMTFTHRLENSLMWLIEHYYCAVQYAPWEQLASEFLKKEVNIEHLLGRISIWLLRYDFVFDYPRPIMPNIVFVGGINCKPKQPMDKEFEKLVNSSGEHGFVVFSLGSMISEIPMDKAMAIAKALGSVPQKVIWRYTGTVPSNLAENTHLVKWLPQNDLLAHPKARAFITHAGSHGIYEAICNAVPLVMLPLFGDQMDNAVRIESRGAGVTLNVLDMTSEDLSNALKTVIEDPSYKKNIEHLSALHLDRPIHPLDLAVYWVEFVMRHKGAPHLRPAAHELNFFQYHSLDVIGFLLLVIITTLFISLKCCSFAFHRCCGKRPRPQSKSKSKSKPE